MQLLFSSSTLRILSLVFLLGAMSHFWVGKSSLAFALLGGSLLAVAFSHEPRSLSALLRRDALDALGAAPVLPFWAAISHYAAIAAFIVSIFL
ncbi:MAG: hypothetical protein L6Q73_14305 [Aquabacterium sp.]|nr:hypothetical protein [Aquabacterium sp.]